MEQFAKEDGHLLMPTMVQQQISAWHKARTIKVQIDTDPNNGEIYKVSSRWDLNPETGVKEEVDLYALLKPALVKIGTAAGIIYDFRSSGVVGEVTRDYVCYQMVGGVISQDGTLTPYKATKEIDITVIEDELRIKAEKQYEYDIKSRNENTRNAALAYGSKEAYVDAKVKPAIIQWRKHKVARAETGAMERLIRQILPLRQQYTLEELKKPFIIPRIDFSPDMNDPTVRKFMLQSQIAGRATLFGPGMQAQLQAANVTPVNVQEDEMPESDYPIEVEEREDLRSSSPAADTDAAGTAPTSPTAKDPEASKSAGTGASRQKGASAQPGAGQQNPTRLDEMPGAQPADWEPQPWELRCINCNCEITQPVYNYSMSYYKRPLCRSCQAIERRRNQEERY